MKAGIYIVFIIAVFFSCSLSAENKNIATLHAGNRCHLLYKE